MGMVCVFLSLRNIMKMHDCRKRQVEIERQRSRKAAKQEKKEKKQGSRTERSKKSREAEKQEKNKIAEKQEKHTSREQKSKHAEKQRSRKAEKQEQKKFMNPKKISEPAQKKLKSIALHKKGLRQKHRPKIKPQIANLFLKGILREIARKSQNTSPRNLQMPESKHCSLLHKL